MPYSTAEAVTDNRPSVSTRLSSRASVFCIAYFINNTYYCFGYDNEHYYHKAEDYGCTFEKTETGFRVTIEHPFKDLNGDLYPYYGLYYFLIPKDLEALKTIEEMARANGLVEGGEPKVTFTNTASTRGTSASTSVKIGVTNDFMPIDKTSETYLDLINPYQGQTRIQLEDATVGGQTFRDTPDGIRPSSITIALYAGDEKVQSRTVTAADGWTWSFTAPKYDENGTEIVYTVKAESVDGYTASVDGYNVTIRHEPESGGSGSGTGAYIIRRRITFFAPDRVAYQFENGFIIIDSETIEVDENETVRFRPRTNYDGFYTMVYINDVLVEPDEDGWYSIAPGRAPVLVSVTPGYIDEDTGKPQSFWELLYNFVMRLFNFISNLFKKG